MNTSRLYILLLIALGLIPMPVQADENNIQETIDHHIAQVVGKNNVTKAKIGGAVALGALGFLGIWLALRQCPCLQDTLVTEKVKTEKEIDPRIRGLVAVVANTFLPATQTVTNEEQKIKEPNICKRCFRSIFCIRSKNKKTA